MSRIAPKPIIAQVVQTWKLPTSLIFALVRDIEGILWIVETCPAGTRFWTPEQAAQLPQGRHSRTVLQAALRLATTMKTQVPMQEERENDYMLTDTVKRLLESVGHDEDVPAQRVRALSSPCLSA